MSNIGTAVIVVLLYLLTPITGKTLFKCQGEYVILEFEKEEYHGGTVTWHKFLTDGNNELIARKVEDEEPYVYANFSHYAEIDRDLNLILRNVSSESSGEYFRRIINGGIFNSSVNLYVMYAPSGKPIVSKEKSGSGKESFNLEMPYLGKPEANVTIKPLKMNITNVAGAIQQYEICLSGRSLQCLEESPCQNFTIRIGQSGIPMQDVEKAPCQNSKIKNESPKTEPLLETAMTAWKILTVAVLLLFGTMYIYVLFYFCRCNLCTLKNIFNWQLYFGFFPAAFVNIVLSIIDLSVNGFVRNAAVGIIVNYIFLLGSSVILLKFVKREMYTKFLAETRDGQKKKKKETTLRISETLDAEKAGDIETKESLLRTSKAGNTERQNCKGDSKRIAFEMKQIGLDKTGQYDDIKPGSSHSV